MIRAAQRSRKPMLLLLDNDTAEKILTSQRVRKREHTHEPAVCYIQVG